MMHTLFSPRGSIVMKIPYLLVPVIFICMAATVTPLDNATGSQFVFGIGQCALVAVGLLVGAWVLYSKYLILLLADGSKEKMYLGSDKNEINAAKKLIDDVCNVNAPSV